MVRVIDTGTGWTILVDGVIRGRFACVLAATREAREWGF